MKTFINKKYEVIKENDYFTVEIIDHRLLRTFIRDFEVITEQDGFDEELNDTPTDQTCYEYGFLIKLTQYDSGAKKMVTSYFTHIDEALLERIDKFCKEIK